MDTVRPVDALRTKFRRGRFELLSQRLPDLVDMSVLDLGGTPSSWAGLPIRPVELTIANLREYEPHPSVDAAQVVGDATDPNLLPGDHYDLVFANSIIEHVGGHEARIRFADNVRRLGTHYWVQVPYRHFPLEPHWRFPFFQYLPVEARIAISNHWDGGGFTGKGKSREDTAALVRSSSQARTRGRRRPGPGP